MCQKSVPPAPRQFGEAVPNEADVAITGPSDAEDVQVGAIRPRDENSTVKSSTESDKLTMDDPIEQSSTHSDHRN